jgi:hypothetical protein
MQIELPIGPLPPAPMTIPTLTKRWQRMPNSKAKRRKTSVEPTA